MTNQPELKIKAGAVTATVWKNSTDNGSYETVQLARNYKDAQGQWKSTGSLRLNDLPKATLLLQKAYEHLTINATEEAVI